MKYKLTVYVSKFMRLGEDNYQTIEVPMELQYDDFEDVENVVRYMVNGSGGSVKFEIKEVEED